MTARFHSKCPCANEIPRGARMFYAPRTKTALCEKPCGQKDENPYQRYQFQNQVHGFFSLSLINVHEPEFA